MNCIGGELVNRIKVRYFWPEGMQPREQNNPRITSLNENYDYVERLYKLYLKELRGIKKSEAELDNQD